MRFKSLKPALLIVCITLFLSGCKKDQFIDQGFTDGDQITMLVDQSWSRMASEDLFPENPSLGIEMLNEGIAADFLLDETFLEDLPPANTSNPAHWYTIRDHSLILCLRGLELTPEQRTTIKQDLRLFDQCKTEAIKRVRAIYRELRAEYHKMFLRIANAYRNGSLTEREFRQKVKELRTGFRSELLLLQLRERLDQALKQCLREFFGELKEVLSDRQWSAFADCYMVSVSP